MFISYRVIALSFLIGGCFSFKLPNLGVEESDDKELDNLLSSIRVLVTGLKKSITIHETKIKNLEANYKSLSKIVGSSQRSLANVERRLNSPRTTCHEYKTTWAPSSNAPIMFLDRQDVACPQGYFLSRFLLNRQGDFNNAPVRYIFRCCKLTL